MSTISDGVKGIMPSSPTPPPAKSQPQSPRPQNVPPSQRIDPWSALRKDDDETDGVFEVRDLRAPKDVGLALRDAINDAVDAVGNMLRTFGMEPVEIPKLGERLGESLFQNLSARASDRAGFVAIEQSTSLSLEVRDIQIFREDEDSKMGFRYTSVSLSIQTQTNLITSGDSAPTFLDLTGRGFADRLPMGTDDGGDLRIALKDVVGGEEGDAFPESLTFDAFSPLLAQANGRTLVPSALFSRPDGTSGLSGARFFGVNV